MLRSNGVDYGVERITIRTRIWILNKGHYGE